MFAARKFCSNRAKFELGKATEYRAARFLFVISSNNMKTTILLPLASKETDTKFWAYKHTAVEPEECIYTERDFGAWVLQNHQSPLWNMEPYGITLHYAHGRMHSIGRVEFASERNRRAWWREQAKRMKEDQNGYLLALNERPQ